jgi:uncharacterized protein YndB with AHSA1/START domain
VLDGRLRAARARAGGRLALDVQGAPVRGRFIELDPPHRLLISWGYAGSARLPAGASTVEIRLIPREGGTRVVVEPRDLPAEERSGHTIGWGHYLARLGVVASGDDPGPDPGMPATAGPAAG